MSRPHRCPFPLVPAGALDALVDHLAARHAPGDDPAATLVVARATRRGLELGLDPLSPDDHPADALLATLVPPPWSVAGLVATGTAHRLDGEEDRGQPVTVIVLVDRQDRVAHRLIGAPGVDRPGPAPPGGRLVDLLLRSLGRPTAPPAVPPQHWWTTAWLDRVVAAISADPGPSPHVAPLVRLHPLVHDHSLVDDEDGLRQLLLGATDVDWSALRRIAASEGGVEPRTDGAGAAARALPVDRDVAAWMDEGCLARWALAELPPLDVLLQATSVLLAPEVGRVVHGLARASCGGWAGTVPDGRATVPEAPGDDR